MELLIHRRDVPAYLTRGSSRSTRARRRLRAPGSEDETLGKVTCHRVGFQANSGKSDIAVRTQEVERRPGDVRALELPVVGGIARNRMRAQQVDEIGQPARRGRGDRLCEPAP